MHAKFILISILLFPFEISAPDFSQLIIWNTGQGQWVTYSTQNRCDHFDVGGEFWNPQAIRYYCYKKENFLYVSHEDQDHISFGFKVVSLLPRICISEKPLTSKKYFTKLLLKKYADCKSLDYTKSKNKSSAVYSNVTHVGHENKYFDVNSVGHENKYLNVERIYTPTIFKTTNDASKVFIVNNVLIPGDSSTKSEKSWAFNLNSKVKYLILGHHGSRTSTSDLLLSHLPSLKLAIASARYARYKHPHLETIERLKRFKVPLLKTEDWGNIHIILQMETRPN